MTSPTTGNHAVARPNCAGLSSRFMETGKLVKNCSAAKKLKLFFSVGIYCQDNSFSAHPELVEGRTLLSLSFHSTLLRASYRFTISGFLFTLFF
jgi:hypothetical protein